MCVAEATICADPGWNRCRCAALSRHPNERTGSEPMPIILWLLGVPLGLVILLVLIGVV
jgi:hypothetical protein